MALFLLLTYLLAAVPFGLVVTTLYGSDVDIRTAGSGNIGATNVARVHGWGLAAPVLVLDVLKGFLPTVVAVLAWPQAPGVWPQVVGLAAFCGHVWPVYLGFRGGKGVATGAGALLALTPASTGLAFAVWLGTFLATGRSSLAALAATLGVVGFTAWLRPDLVIAVAVVGVLVTWRHLANIRRLVRGTEESLVPTVRWGRSRAVPPAAAEVLEQGPSGTGEAPALWDEPVPDPLEPGGEE